MAVFALNDYLRPFGFEPMKHAKNKEDGSKPIFFVLVRHEGLEPPTF